jgi:hypothetical protein
MKKLINFFNLNKVLFGYCCDNLIDELKEEQELLDWEINVDKVMDDSLIVKLHNNDKKIKQLQKVKVLYCKEPKIKKCRCKSTCSGCQKD